MTSLPAPPGPAVTSLPVPPGLEVTSQTAPLGPAGHRQPAALGPVGSFDRDDMSPPQTFTTLKALDPNDCSFGSLLSFSDCSFGILEELEVDVADHELQRLYRPDEPVTAAGDAATDAGVAFDIPASPSAAGPSSSGDGQGTMREGDQDKENRPETASTYAKKHPLLPPPDICSEGRCRNKCAIKVPESVRAKLNKGVTEMRWDTRAFWYQKHVTVKEVARRTADEGSSQRQKSLLWHLPLDELQLVPVCKGFFLTTVGLNKANDMPIRTALGIKSVQPIDKRGRQAAVNRADHANIKKHIESYRPSAPHYRYLHAPDRRYLPADISVRDMHKDYNDSNPAVSYTTYREEVVSMNIGFTVLGKEECDACKIHLHHNSSQHGRPQNSQEHTDGCAECDKHTLHITRARSAREEYRQDADRTPDDDEAVCSADLMKIALIPILPHKRAVFTPRLVVFNETFAPLVEKGSRGSGKKPLAVLWHEAVAGRDAEDVAAAFWQYLLQNRDKRLITIYADNCAAQQKSWLFATVLITYLQQAHNATERITIKYLETGHTAMSADSSHQVIQKKLAKSQVICDFQDFVKLTEDSGVLVKTLKPEDFMNFENGVSQKKLNALKSEGLRPHLREFRVIQARRGSERLFVKAEHTDRTWRTYDLLKNTYDSTEAPPCRTAPRGVNSAKIGEICRNLLPLMPAHKRQFWENLHATCARAVRDLNQ